MLARGKLDRPGGDAGGHEFRIWQEVLMVRVLNGADRLGTADRLLRGRRIAMLTSASGVDKSGVPTYIKIWQKYNLVALMAPEHGISSNLQDGGWGSETRDMYTGTPVYNLRAGGGEALETALSGADIAVYDIQDVGARFYTYLYNLTDLMHRCAGIGIPLIVLDRINPISGGMVQGLLLDEEKYSSSIGRYSIPTRYGLTVGEFARYINGEKKVGCELHVIPCEGWQRELYADLTDLLWVNPSPNIPSVNAAINYTGTCIFEATNISEGRGTTRPFDMVGAPFVNPSLLLDELRSYELDGVVFRRVHFTPQFGKHTGQVCGGVELHITDRDAYDPVLAALSVFRHMRRYPEFTCREEGLCKRFGTDFLLGGCDVGLYRAMSRSQAKKFWVRASEYLLY
jgi:uncharacterized protein YbbC (DUF1343 family)